MFSDLAADRFVHLSASDGDLTADDDLAVGYDGKLCTLCTDVYDHAALILFRVDSHAMASAIGDSTIKTRFSVSQ